jgi:small subunit ribosomal protein S20
MAITSSAKKALRQSLKRKEQNSDKKNKLRKTLRELKSLVALKKNAEAEKLLPLVFKLLDKAVKVGLIKKNAASRKKSRIAKLFSKKESK